ncbi:sigma-70 family RNA polymerase sigma factor [Sorangium sp. So ce693]|uniref:sigma-70 family RNA polymerase sigma factor n=1 Tax=Sorangium sp. So ce693 TaxID=3133318 RepID=UPI003F630A95
MDCPDEGKRAAAYARLFCPMLVRAVLLWLERMGVPQCQRGDVAGQVWLNACESWPRFDPKRGRPERWLNAITVHVASHYHERARKRREELVSSIEVLDPAPDAAAVMESDNVRASTMDAVNELDPVLRLVLVAHDLGGVSMAQIAQDAGLPLSTLYRRRARAIGELRNILMLREAGEISPRGVGLQ